MFILSASYLYLFERIFDTFSENLFFVETDVALAKSGKFPKCKE